MRALASVVHVCAHITRRVRRTELPLIASLFLLALYGATFLLALWLAASHRPYLAIATVIPWAIGLTSSRAGPMASKRHQRRKSCGHKHRDPSQAEAVAHLVHLRAKGDWDMAGMHTYHCQRCGFWHVGH